ncbi:MAG: hypothetical protein PVH25_15660 [Burkholderiales bacterium]
MTLTAIQANADNSPVDAAIGGGIGGAAGAVIGLEIHYGLEAGVPAVGADEPEVGHCAGHAPER